jgi:hypothetical protein
MCCGFSCVAFQSSQARSQNIPYGRFGDRAEVFSHHPAWGQRVQLSMQVQAGHFSGLKVCLMASFTDRTAAILRWDPIGLLEVQAEETCEWPVCR